MTEPRLRPAVRALIVDEAGRVLLVHFSDSFVEVEGGFWACPGGGIDPGETDVQALARELEEELGLVDPVIEGGLWRLTRLFPMTRWDGQAETTYLVRVQDFEPAPRVDLLAEGIDGVRWFSRAEIAAGEVVFSPRDLHAQLERWDREGTPSAPIDIPAL